MAKKFSIAQNATFKEKVKIPRVGGEPIEVELEYKYLPRTEFAEMLERWKTKAAQIFEGVSEESSLVELTEAQLDHQVVQLKDILAGWSFDDEFNDDNIRQLCNVCTKAPEVIVEQYNKAYSEVKLGN
jgi:hypothetical protein